MYRDASTDLDEHDRAVGAILIGEALVAQIEQTAEELRQPHAADRWRKLRDAQDDYPEIWRQLDRARHELALRGANTMGYEELRPHVRTALATSGDDRAQRIDCDALEDARRAIAELKLAVPGTDWRAIDRRTNTLVETPQLHKRQWVGITSVLTLLLAAGATWIIGAIPPEKVDDREVMRRELGDVVRARKVKIEYLRHANVTQCAPPLAQEYTKLLVMDGRGDAAELFADDYLVRCGEDTVVENWANAPRPPTRDL